MDFAGSLHELHRGYEGSLEGMDFPAGSAGQLLFGVLYLPNAVIRTVEFLAVNFGSSISDDWDL